MLHPFLVEQHHSAFLGHSLCRRPGADQRFQLRFSGVINRQSGGGRKHDPIESWPAYVVNSYVGRDTRRAAPVSGQSWMELKSDAVAQFPARYTSDCPPEWNHNRWSITGRTVSESFTDTLAPATLPP